MLCACRNNCTLMRNCYVVESLLKQSIMYTKNLRPSSHKSKKVRTVKRIASTRDQPGTICVGPLHYESCVRETNINESLQVYPTFGMLNSCIPFATMLTNDLTFRFGMSICFFFCLNRPVNTKFFFSNLPNTLPCLNMTFKIQHYKVSKMSKIYI